MIITGVSPNSIGLEVVRVVAVFGGVEVDGGGGGEDEDAGGDCDGAACCALEGEGLEGLAHDAHCRWRLLGDVVLTDVAREELTLPQRAHTHALAQEAIVKVHPIYGILPPTASRNHFLDLHSQVFRVLRMCGKIVQSVRKGLRVTVGVKQGRLSSSRTYHRSRVNRGEVGSDEPEGRVVQFILLATVVFLHEPHDKVVLYAALAPRRLANETSLTNSFFVILSRPSSDRSLANGLRKFSVRVTVPCTCQMMRATSLWLISPSVSSYVK